MIERAMRSVVAVATVATVALAGAGAACADTVEQFYKGRTIDLVVGTAPGGGYDDYARLLARHMVRHIPGQPGIVVKYMAGAGGRTAINYVYSIMAKDGSGFGSTQKNVPFDPLYGVEATKVDATRLNWIGNLNSEVPLCIVRADKGVKSIEDARRQEVLIGSTGVSTTDSVISRLLNRVAGTRLKVVQGYQGSTGIYVAMERGEIDGRCGMGYDSLMSRYSHWLAEKKIDILAQFALKKHPDIPDVPFALDLATNEADRQLLELLLAPNELGRPFFAPPGVPTDRVEALRTAFAKAAQDKELLAEAKSHNIIIDLMTGQETEQFVRQIYKTPKEVVERAKSLVEGP